MRAHLIRTAGALLAGLAFLAPAAGADTFEPNDSIAQATGPLVPLTPYVSFIGTVNDVDFYYLDANLGDFIADLQVPNDPNIDYDLAVVDADLNILIESVNDAGIDEEIEATVTGAGRFYLMVTPFSGFSNSQSYTLTVNFTPLNSSPTVQVTSPNGGEVYTPGSHHNITWTASDAEDGTNLTIDIDLTTDGGNSFSPVAAAITNTGVFDWTVPAVSTTQARIRVIAHDSGGGTGGDASNANFTIQVPQNQLPAVTVTAPNGGETLTQGVQTLVQWNANDAEDGGTLSIAIDFSGDGGTTFSPVASGLLNSGSFAWTVPGVLTTEGRIRVTATDSQQGAGSDLSNANFTIQTSLPPGTASLTVGSGIQVGVGQTVSVPINLENTQAMGALQVTVNYDPALVTAQNATAESRGTVMTLGKNLSQPGKAVLTLTSTSGASVPAGNGVVASIQFLAGSVGGTSSLTPSGAVVSDVVGRAMTLTVNAGSVTVIGGVPEVTLQVPALAANPGAVLDVPVAFNSNLGVSAFQFALEFNPAVLAPASLTQGGRTTGMTMQQNLAQSGRVRVVFYFPGGGTLAPGSGTACTIRFNVAADSPGNTALTFADVVCSDASGNGVAVTTVSGSVTGVRLLAFTAEAEPLGVRIRWSVEADAAHAGFRVLRGAGDPQPLHAGLLPPDTSSYLDTGAEPGRILHYWLEAVDRAGDVQRFGPVSVTFPVTALRVGYPYPNPMRAESRIDVAGLAAGARVVVVDVSGRRVRELDAPSGDAGSLVWDGRDDAGAVAPAGIYFVRILSGSTEATRRLIKAGS